jgi:ABC-type antimicrobial peptide transport system permease subunit
MSYSVQQRTQEIGIRVALGADHGKIMKMIVGHGVRLAVIGTGAGLVLAYVTVKFLGKFLFGLKGSDPLAFSMVAVVLFVVTLIAAFIPALRATRVDPIIALRQE